MHAGLSDSDPMKNHDFSQFYTSVIVMAFDGFIDFFKNYLKHLGINHADSLTLTANKKAKLAF